MLTDPKTTLKLLTLHPCYKQYLPGSYKPGKIVCSRGWLQADDNSPHRRSLGQRDHHPCSGLLRVCRTLCSGRNRHPMQPIAKVCIIRPWLEREITLWTRWTSIGYRLPSTWIRSIGSRGWVVVQKSPPGSKGLVKKSPTSNCPPCAQTPPLKLTPNANASERRQTCVFTSTLLLRATEIYWGNFVTQNFHRGGFALNKLSFLWFN